MNNVEYREVDLVPIARNLVAMGVISRPEVQKLLPLNNDEIISRFEPITPTNGKFFDININSNDEVARVLIEEMVTRDLRQKITNSDPIVTVDGVAQISFSEYNPHARAEHEATQKEFWLAKKGYNLIFWISAEDGGKVYEGGRFNIVFASHVGKELSLKGKHLDLGIDRFQSFEIGKKLVEIGGRTFGVMDTVESLRVEPIGFKLENLDNWIGECRKMMPELELFWKFIENGGDIKQEEKIKKAVIEAKAIANGDNVIFQREMEKRGVEVNKSGNHGSGYLGSEDISIQNYRIQVINGEYYTEPVHDKFGRLVCPVCGEIVSEGMSSCPKCKINLLTG